MVEKSRKRHLLEVRKNILLITTETEKMIFKGRRTMRARKRRERKNPSIPLDINPCLLCHKVCALQLCYNCCPPLFKHIWLPAQILKSHHYRIERDPRNEVQSWPQKTGQHCIVSDQNVSFAAIVAFLHCFEGWHFDAELFYALKQLLFMLVIAPGNSVIAFPPYPRQVPKTNKLF